MADSQGASSGTAPSRTTSGRRLTLTDWPIFSAGTHKGDTYTEADLTEMLRVHDTHRGNPDYEPLVLRGHDNPEHGQQAKPEDILGGIPNMKRTGGVLRGDLDIDDPKMVEWLSQFDATGLRRRIRLSAEIVKREGVGQFLRAVALVPNPHLRDLPKDGSIQFHSEDYEGAGIRIASSTPSDGEGVRMSLVEKFRTWFAEVKGELPADKQAALEAQGAALFEEKTKPGDSSPERTVQLTEAAQKMVEGAQAQAKAATEKAEALEKQFAEQQTEHRAELAAREVGDLIGKGKLFPSCREYAEAILRSPADVVVKTYSEKDGTKTAVETKMAAADAFRKFLDAQGKVIDFGTLSVHSTEEDNKARFTESGDPNKVAEAEAERIAKGAGWSADADDKGVKP